MGHFAYNDKLSFFLPDWIEVDEVIEDDGEERTVLNIGLYLDDDGNIQRRTSAAFGKIHFNAPDNKYLTVEEVCEDMAGANDGLRYYVVPGKPESMFMNMAMPVSVLGMELKLRNHYFAVRVSKETMVTVNVAKEMSDDYEENLRFYEDMLEVARAVRVDGEPLPLNELSAEFLMQAIEPEFEEDDEAIDITSCIKVEVSNGEETAIFSFSENEIEQEDSNASSGWGQNLTIEGNESGADVEDDSSGSAWGSGLTIDGKPVR